MWYLSVLCCTLILLLLQVPGKLLLQMPRFGKEFKMYNKIIPSLNLDVVPLLDSVSTSQSLRANQQCYLCGAPAAVSCTQCASEVFQAKADKVDLCWGCSDRSHNYRQSHSPTELFNPGGDGGSRISKMELLSVICIETSHYVCFTHFEDRWLFHDSMANRLCKWRHCSQLNKSYCSLSPPQMTCTTSLV